MGAAAAVACAPVADPAFYRSRSLWLDQLDDDPLVPRPALPGPLDVDVAIVGAGFTGLWTAHYLAASRPPSADRRDRAGHRRLRCLRPQRRLVLGLAADEPGRPWRPATAATRRSRCSERCTTTVDEVGRAAAAAGIDCHYTKGGYVHLATAPLHLARLRAELAESAQFGLGDDDLRWLGPPRGAGHGRRRRCAWRAVHAPLRGDPAGAAGPWAGACCGGTRRAGVRGDGGGGHRARPRADGDGRRARRRCGAGDGGLHGRPGRRASHRGPRLLPDGGDRAAGARACGTSSASTAARPSTTPATSSSTASAPRTAASPSEAGARRTTSAPASMPASTVTNGVFDDLRGVLRRLFPVLHEASFTHAWGGPLAIPRDWHCSVGFDRATGLAWAGGYVGDGVATTNLAGRTLADLITGRPSELTSLAWVDHRSPPLGARAAALDRHQRRAAADGGRRQRRRHARAGHHAGVPRCSTA